MADRTTPLLIPAGFGPELELEELGPLAPPVGEPIDGPMATRGRIFWTSADERVFTGIWEVDAGRMRADFSKHDGEMVHIASGRMTCIPDDGNPFELGPGDVMTFTPGWRGVWEIHEPMRKFYTVFLVGT